MASINNHMEGTWLSLEYKNQTKTVPPRTKNIVYSKSTRTNRKDEILADDINARYKKQRI